MKLRVRAEESLKKSQLPPRMAARGLCKVYFLLFIDNYSQKDAEFNDISRRKAFLDEMERSAALTDKPKFQPQIHHSVPDFKQLQADFETTLTLKKQSRPKTTPKPFSITDAKGKSGAAARLAKVPSTHNRKYIFTSQDHAGNRARRGNAARDSMAFFGSSLCTQGSTLRSTRPVHRLRVQSSCRANISTDSLSLIAPRYDTENPTTARV